VPINASVTATFNAPKNSGRVLGSAIFKQIVSSEALFLGNGDLHLAVGDGSIPWKQIISNTKIKSDTVFNIELDPELWFDLEKCVNSTLELIEFSKNKSK
tara:strand:+ start:664 stop:963 length:300 start_codon:yes stop_codon:yes gene_type:complete